MVKLRLTSFTGLLACGQLHSQETYGPKKTIPCLEFRLSALLSSLQCVG